jgi:protein-S-isoprenylcysteine O-methyltransferase Ste14
MKHLKAFGMFWYDFIIGDDWKIAVAVVSALAITGAVMAVVHSGGGSLTPWTILGAALILGFFALSLTLDAKLGLTRTK